MLLQSCHLEEEDEGGEEEGVHSTEDEMSFEVRQSELVMGGRGLGIGDTIWSGSSRRIE